MIDTFPRLANDLALASSLEEKKSLSRELSACLAQDSSLAQGLVSPTIMAVLRGIPALDYAIEEDLVFLRVGVYTDTDGLAKITIGVAYLQDFTRPTLRLDDMVLLEVLDALNHLNLDILANDLTVNTVQLRGEEIPAIYRS